MSSQVVFEAIRGTDYQGDISIDDIKMASGKCPVQPNTCDFEQDICDYRQSSTDKSNWVRGTGSTGSFNTGPGMATTLSEYS